MGTEWFRQQEQGGPLIALAERVKQLRNEHGWSQGELAERVGADPAQISRYENGRITPSADALIRLAEVFDVSCDYLILEEPPAAASAPPKTASETLAGLGDHDRELVLSFIDALDTKTRLKALAGGIS